jgi:hypothetical protein
MPWQQKTTIIVILTASFLGFGCSSTKTDTTQAASNKSDSEAVQSAQHVYYKSDDALQKIKAERKEKAEIAREREIARLNKAKQLKEKASLANLCNAAQFDKDAPVVCRDIIHGDIRGPYLSLLGGINDNPFFISRYEARKGDYLFYCQDTGNCEMPKGSLLLPINDISINDVHDYAAWLSARTGYTYRLPSLAEWTYAAKADGSKQPTVKNCQVYAGTILQYGIKLENINFQRVRTSNAWGIANYLGNVQELVTEGDTYVAVGGHLDDPFEECEISTKRGVETRLDERTGFRLVRER